MINFAALKTIAIALKQKITVMYFDLYLENGDSKVSAALKCDRGILQEPERVQKKLNFVHMYIQQIMLGIGESLTAHYLFCYRGFK